MGDWIQMAIKSVRARKGSLKGLFLRFLLSIVISVILVIVIYGTLIGIGVYQGFLLPADSFSNIVNEYEKTLDSGGIIDLDEVPPEISYVVFDSDGQVEAATLSDKKVNRVKDLIQTQGTTKISDSYNMQRQYQIVRTNQSIYVFEYYITAEFASPLLRSMFPHVEWTLLLCLIFLILMDVLLVSVLFAGRLSKKVNYMKQATDQIKNQQLDFVVENTGIKEFDSVMSSLDELRTHLRESFSQQWQLQQQKKEQMGALAHDIKTPLTIIRGNTDLLLETELSGEQKDYLSYISNNVLRIQEYVKNLIEISRGKMELGKKQDVKVSEFIEDIEEQFLPLLKYKNLKLISHHRIKAKNINMNPVFLIRALMNLVDNAVYYSRFSGIIYFDTWEESGYYCLSIEDEGKGFSKEDLKYATTEFYRGNQNRKMDGHYGMGLSIALQIATMHNGDILVENGQRGAKVTLRIK